MRVVVDTNILVSFFRLNPVHSIILDCSSLGLELSTPEFSFDELKANLPGLRKYSGLSDGELELVELALRSCIEAIPLESFEEYVAAGEKATPDQKDKLFFALALKLNASIWSNEPRLKKQSSVPVLSTSDMRKLLGV